VSLGGPVTSLLNNCLRGLVSQDPSKAICHPLGVAVKTSCSVESKKTRIAINNVEFGAVLKLPQAHRAKVQRSRIAFFQVVGAVQHTLKVYAMQQAEHMARLMGQDLAASPQQKLLVIGPAFAAVKSGVVTSKAVNANSFPK